MVEHGDTARSAESDETADDISAFDAAQYCYEMAGEMARLAHRGGMDGLAMALEHVRAVAAHEMHGARADQPDPEKPAPGEAA